MSTKCKSCGAEILWIKTFAGRNMPVDASSVQDGYVTEKTRFDSSVHVSHFSTCPNADEHRHK